MRTKYLIFVLSFIAAPLFSAPCKADTVTYTAYLLGSTAVPPTLSPATATETLTLSGNLLTVHLDFGVFGSNVLGAGIHCCSDTYTNSALVLSFPGFPAATSGTYDHTFSLLTDLSGMPESSFVQGLNAGLAYTAISSQIYPNGAIRGQVQLAPVPEPSSLLLVSSGALSALGAYRRHVRWTTSSI